MAAIGKESVEIIDEPDSWKTEMSMEDIVNFRARLLRFTTQPIEVNSALSPPKVIDITQEQIQSSIPVDLEIKFNKTPKINMSFDRFTQPMGARVQVSNLQLASTPKIPYQTDKIVTDTDMSSIQAVSDLYSSNHTVTQIMRLFSSGLLGLKKNRKFVPTRWSITAVDDILGNRLRLKLLDYPSIDSFHVYHNSYLDNDFWILFIPKHDWFFNYHESWKQKSAWNLVGKTPRIYSDHEGPKGRSSYATNTLGGYYAARLAVLEKLNELRRMAAVLAFREVGKGYSIPLGVWQVRENMREAMKMSKKFDTIEKALNHISPNLTIPMKYYHYQSPLLNQTTLDKFIHIR
jgi:hypothetical protein